MINEGKDDLNNHHVDGNKSCNVPNFNTGFYFGEHQISAATVLLLDRLDKAIDLLEMISQSLFILESIESKRDRKDIPDKEKHFMPPVSSENLYEDIIKFKRTKKKEKI